MGASEFDLIDKYFATQAAGGDVTLGIGDDCAVVRPPEGRSLAITTDTLVEGIHFHAGTAPEDIAMKSLAVNLSDLAAMGARPKWITLCLTLPTGDEAWLCAFAAELHTVLQRYRCSLIGGDITHGPLSITIQAIGTVEEAFYMRRDGANIDDAVYVTGTLGDAAIGLSASDRAIVDRDWFMQRLNRPVPRVAFGEAATRYCSCAIDISDGLAADLGHILDRSKVGAEIELANVPLSRQARDYFKDAGAVDWTLVLTGGDDYELCLAVPSCHEQAFKQMAADMQVPVSRIGVFTESRRLQLLTEDGSELGLDHAGYRHF